MDSGKSHSWSPGDSAALAAHSRRNFEIANCNPSRTAARGDGLLGDTPILPYPKSQIEQSSNRRRPNARPTEDLREQQQPPATRQPAFSRGSAANCPPVASGIQPIHGAQQFGGHLPRRWTIWIDHPHRQAGLSDDFRIETTVSIMLCLWALIPFRIFFWTNPGLR
jgi:hypothetical protein